MTDLQIIHQTSDFIVLYKEAGIPTQPDLTGDDSMLKRAETSLKQLLFVVHRLDRPVSGLLVFARNKVAAARLAGMFKSKISKKVYLAAVRTAPDPPDGHLVHFLSKNKNKKAVVSKEQVEGSKRAELRYETIGNSDKYTFLKVHIFTGRHHQIRAQLASIGCTIKGDVRYGDRRANPDRSIHLHAWYLAFPDLETGEKLEFYAELPENDAVWASLVV